MDFTETLKLAESKGYKSPYYVPVNNELLQCTLIQVWLMKEHRIFVTVAVDRYNLSHPFSADVKSLSSKNYCERLLDGFTTYTEYENALAQGIQEALKLI